MAVKFDFYKTPIPADRMQKKRYHARVAAYNTVSTDYIVKDIQEKCSLTKGDVLAALSALSSSLAYHLGNGQRVHLRGIGYFQVTLQCPETRDPKETHAQNVRFKSVKYIADQPLKDELKTLKTERTRQCRHSTTQSDVRIDMKLKDYFSENKIMTRKDFERACHLTRTTACRQLKRLKEEGKLQNINTRVNPVYVPAPGYYGMPIGGGEREGSPANADE